jgi:hypothetical protein
MQLEDVDGILGYHGEPNTMNSVFNAAGKVAYMNLIKIEVADIKFNHSVGDTSDGITIHDATVPEWVKGGENDPAAYKKNTSVTIKAKFSVLPTSVTSAKIRATTSDSILGNLGEQTVNFSSGESEYVTFSPSNSTPGSIGENTVAWQWKAKDLNGESLSEYNINLSGPHTIYTIYASPLCDNINITKGHVDWACNIAKETNTVTAAAEKFKDAIAIAPGYAEPRIFNISDSWAFLASGQHGDCITLAQLAREGLWLIGIPAGSYCSYPTADGTSGYPAVSGNSCRNMTTATFEYEGETFNARLVYPGNNFEGFFMVSDPDIKGYTIYTPGGPFENQTYYYLEVLQFAAGAGGDQFWAWDCPYYPYYIIKNGVRVDDGQPVPDASHISVPSIP